MLDKNNIITDKHRFNRIITYVENHLALVSLLGTFIIAACSVLFKVLTYLFTFGQYMALGIHYQYITIADENVFYQVLLYSAIVIIAFVPNYLCYASLKLRKTFKLVMLKLISHVFVVLLMSLVVVLFIVLLAITRNMVKFNDLNWSKTIDLILHVSFILYLLFCVFGHIVIVLQKFVFNAYKCWKKISCKFCKPTSTPASAGVPKSDLTSTIIIITLLLSCLAVYCLAVGYSYGDELTSFKMIQNTATPAVVLCETADNYIVSECIVEMQNNSITIYTNTEKMINKTDVPIIKVDFKNVSRAKKSLLDS